MLDKIMLNLNTFVTQKISHIHPNLLQYFFFFGANKNMKKLDMDHKLLTRS